MGITTKKLWELFETSWLAQRQNPGGTSPYLKGYLLGIAGTVNILEAIDPAAKTGDIKLKVGSGPVQVRTVDFSAALPAALTPAQAAQALTNAGFTGCVFTVDPETNRLKLAPADTGVKWIQIYGDLAAALNFGNCRYAEGKGCYLWPSFDGDLKSAAETEQWTEDTVIENTSPLGTPVKYTVPGRRSGTQIVLVDRLHSYAAKQMINGGKWIGGDADNPEMYEPPVASDNEARRIDVFTYSQVMDKHEGSTGDEAFILERLYVGCVGKMIQTGGAGSMKDSEYTLTAATYIGDDGTEHASPRESNYTLAQWEALGMPDILVGDWENA